ncbi:hypothetical protein GJ496_010402 [Pomphorhynchus laevis]|nr:hypothetical protein GJ496_010402 [Pomphorhynchus laevis]
MAVSCYNYSFATTIFGGLASIIVLFDHFALNYLKTDSDELICFLSYLGFCASILNLSFISILTEYCSIYEWFVQLSIFLVFCFLCVRNRPFARFGIFCVSGITMLAIYWFLNLSEIVVTFYLDSEINYVYPVHYLFLLCSTLTLTVITCILAFTMIFDMFGFRWLTGMLVNRRLRSIKFFQLPNAVSSLVESVFHQNHYSVFKIRSILFWLGLLVLKLFGNFLNLCSPLLLNRILTLSGSRFNARYVLIFSLLLLMVTFFKCLLNVQYQYHLVTTEAMLRCHLSNRLYTGILSEHCNIGQIVTLVSVDVGRMINMVNSCIELFALSCQLVAVLIILYNQLALATIPGVLLAVLIIVVNRFIAARIAIFNTKLLEAKDKRVQLMSEILSFIFAIKSNNLESVLTKKVCATRKEEIHQIRNLKYLDAICVFLWSTTPVLLSAATFSTYLYMGNKLDVPKVYTCMSLLGMLIMPLNAIPWVINGLVEGFVSVQRYNHFINQQCDSPLPSNLECTASTLMTLIENKCPKLIIVKGPIGSGKSRVLAELCKHLAKPIGYVNGQHSFLINTSIRDNIQFGLRMQSQRYNDAIKQSCLVNDIQAFDKKDDFVVGKDGSNLSGGQKMRVNLARAIYQDCKVYLLDDPFASVDADVAVLILNECIIPLAHHYTVVIVTNHDYNINSIPHLILTLDADGDISDKVFRREEAFSNVSMQKYEIGSEDYEREFHIDESTYEESTHYGSVKLDVIKLYISNFGLPTAIIFVIFLIGMQASSMCIDYWISVSLNNQANHEISFTRQFLIVYVILIFTNLIFTFIRAFSFAYGSISASKAIHQVLLGKVVKAPISFFSQCKYGQIVNRFSSDTVIIDDDLPFVINILVTGIISALGSLFLTCFVAPYTMITLPFIFLAYYLIQYMYRRCCRNLQRFSACSLSPLFAHISETINGLLTLTALNANDWFYLKFRTILLDAIRYSFFNNVVSCWLHMRLILIVSLLIICVCFVTIKNELNDQVDLAFTGLAVTYLLNLVNQLNGLVSSMADTEKRFVSVERVHQYTNEELKAISPTLLQPQKREGQQVKLLKYNIHTTTRIVISNLNLHVVKGDPLGLVGRTGSGKSSTLKSLILHDMIHSGRIVINDSIDITKLPESDMRYMISFVTQDAAIFNGSLRFNLDPQGTASTRQLIDVTKMLKLTDFSNEDEITSMLDAETIEDNGRKISAGKRQLICFGRALISRKPIICIDEATANIDAPSDSIISFLIRTAFKESCVILASHRLSTLKSSCRFAAVIHNGIIEEYGLINDLIDNPTSKFSQLLCK